MSEQRKRKRKKRWGLRIFLGLLAVLVLTVGGYVYSVYRNLSKTTDTIYTPVETQPVREAGVDLTQQTPISILLMGIDNGAEGRTEAGRSDSMIVVTINPKTQTTTMVSIPRDTFSEIVGNDTYDKINHAYWFGGAEMAINTVQKLLGIPIDYYASINMEGLKQMVDVVGGITVNSPLAFTSRGYTFVEGSNQMNGEAALAFSRMREEDPTQDTGRQDRQRLVIEAIIHNLIQTDMLLSYQDILHSLSANVETSLQMSDYLALQQNGYVSAVSNIKQDHLGGVGGLRDEIYYSFVDGAELNRVQEVLKTELELP